MEWRILVPYVALYFSAQMLLWWPLWNIDRVAWVVYLVLFVPSTILNIRGHAAGGSKPGSPPALADCGVQPAAVPSRSLAPAGS